MPFARIRVSFYEFGEIREIREIREIGEIGERHNPLSGLIWAL